MDGEELHEFIEDGLAKHLKVQVSLSSLARPYIVWVTTSAQSRGGLVAPQLCLRPRRGDPQWGWASAGCCRRALTATCVRRVCVVPQVDLEPEAQTQYGPSVCAAGMLQRLAPQCRLCALALVAVRAV